MRSWCGRECAAIGRPSLEAEIGGASIARWEYLEVAGGVRAAQFEDEAPSLKVTDLLSKGLGLSDTRELMEARSRHTRSDPAVSASGLGQTACCLGDRSKHTEVNGVSLLVAEQCARHVTKPIGVEIRQSSEILRFAARIWYA